MFENYSPFFTDNKTEVARLTAVASLTGLLILLTSIRSSLNSTFFYCVFVVLIILIATLTIYSSVLKPIFTKVMNLKKRRRLRRLTPKYYPQFRKTIQEFQKFVSPNSDYSINKIILKLSEVLPSVGELTPESALGRGLEKFGVKVQQATEGSSTNPNWYKSAYKESIGVLNSHLHIQYEMIKKTFSVQEAGLNRGFKAYENLRFDVETFEVFLENLINFLQSFIQVIRLLGEGTTAYEVLKREYNLFISELKTAYKEYEKLAKEANKVYVTVNNNNISGIWVFESMLKQVSMI